MTDRQKAVWAHLNQLSGSALSHGRPLVVRPAKPRVALGEQPRDGLEQEIESAFDALAQLLAAGQRLETESHGGEWTSRAALLWHCELMVRQLGSYCCRDGRPV